MIDPPPTRRRRLHAEMRAAILDAAVTQVRMGGVEALSLNAIGRALGTSGPALYRYFASRDVLLASVVTRAYDDLAETLERAFDAARRRRPEGRVRAVATAYRGWARRERELYRAVFSSPAGSGATSPETVAPAATRSMAVLLRALGATDGGAVGRLPPGLAAELVAWATDRGLEVRDPGTLARGVRAWTRMHGVVSLELEGAWGAMGLDPRRVFDAEVDSLLSAR